MEEIMIAKLGTEDIAKVKELKEAENEVATLSLQLRSAHYSLWEHLQRQYKLDFSPGHYIKNNRIYKQVV